MSYSASRKISSGTAFVRVTLTNGRPKRGLLDMLPSLPLDILCEVRISHYHTQSLFTIAVQIFCFLHPADLLVLARTSKAFRHFLLKRPAAFIWRSAQRNVVGLPEPPSDMNEVQYASLVFGSGCHYQVHQVYTDLSAMLSRTSQGCDRKARDTVWHLRIRSCASCRLKHQ
jgi:hypothetical protein